MNNFNNQINPRYLKLQQIGFFQRILNSLTEFCASLTNGLILIIWSPLNALTSFAKTSHYVVDYELYYSDLAKLDEQYSGSQTIKLELPDEDEEWKKAHKEEYGSGDDES